MVSQLEREKILLDGQLRNMEWKLDQEANAYHTAKQSLKQTPDALGRALISSGFSVLRSTPLLYYLRNKIDFGQNFCIYFIFSGH